MAITQRGSTTSATTTTANSLACNKPTGVVSGDVMVALITSNDGTITSTGWTPIGADFGTNPFGGSWLYKVAGGSEPSSYTFSNNSGTAPPIVISISAWIGVDTSGSPIGGATVTGSGSSTEPKSIPGCTNTPLALPFYSRSCRVSHNVSDIPTFSASGVTSLNSTGTGIFSGGTVNYGHVMYIATEATGNPASLNVTESSSTAESDNVVASFTLKTLITDVSVNAGVATVTAAANDAVGQAAFTVGTATVTAAAIQPGIIAGNASPAGLTSVTGAALDATVKITANAEVTTVTGSASSGGVYYGAPPGRTVVVGSEGRTYAPASESRVYTVQIIGSD